VFGATVDSNASAAVIITTSSSTSSAKECVQDKPIRLIDGPELVHLLAVHLKLNAVIDSGPLLMIPTKRTYSNEVML
jgi:hypothetical protein